MALIEPLIRLAKLDGNKRKVIMEEVVDALMDVLSTGCQSRAIPNRDPRKISAAMLAVFTAIRECCARVMQKGRVVPETSSSRAPRFRTLGAKRRAADERATPKILKTPELPV